MFSRKKTVCGVCGYRFVPTKENIYTAEEPRTMFETISKAPTRFSVVDCPRCGCQIPLAIRVPRVDLSPVADQSDEEESEVADNEQSASIL